MIGDIRGIQQAADIASRTGTAWGVGPRGVYVSLFGFPTLPKVPPGDFSGAGRIPRHMNIDSAGHPAIWLDPDNRRPLLGEDEQTYIIRIFLELQLRGYWIDGQLVGPTGEEFVPVDVLKLANLDVDDFDTRMRLEAYRDGYPDDEELNCLTLAKGSMDDVEPGWLVEESTKLYAKFMLMWQDNAMARDMELAQSVIKAEEELRSADLTSLLYQSATVYREMVEGKMAENKRAAYHALATAVIQAGQSYDRLYDDLTLLECTSIPLSVQSTTQIRTLAEADKVRRSAEIENIVRAITGFSTEAPVHFMQVAKQWFDDIVRRRDTLLNAGAHHLLMKNRIDQRNQIIGELLEKVQQ